MGSPESTCWSVLHAAAAGDLAQREAFARRYDRAVREYLAARWRGSPLSADVDDAVQEVFLECFRTGGLLSKADASRGFRPLLYGALRNVALRFEQTRGRRREHTDASGLAELPADETSLSRVFDRAWAQALMREAALLQEQRAVDEAGRRRLELLRLRFHDDLPIREIAGRWNADAAVLHHEYAKARREFHDALLEIIAYHEPGADLERACADLLAALG